MAEPVQVLQVLGSSAGGVARHVSQVARALSADAPDGPGWTVTVAAPAGLAEVVAAPGGPVAFRALEIADRPRREDVAAVRALRSLAAGVDVLHAHGLRAGALAVLAARTLPRAQRPRLIVTLHNRPVGGRAIRAVSAALEQVVVRGADVVLGVSGDLVARARRLGARSAERALVPAPQRHRAVDDAGPLQAAADHAGAAAGPVEAAADHPTAEPDVDHETVRAGLGIEAGTALLVTVARLAPQKGLDTLLDAAEILTAGRAEPGRAEPGRAEPGHAVASPQAPADGGRDPVPPAASVAWVVAGDGPLHGALTARIESGGLPVRLLGRREDAPDLMAAADVVVSTAVWEGQPIAIQEALGVGAAVVATDAGGTREVTGTAAVLVPVGDAPALAAAVRALLDDPAGRSDLRRRARARAAELPDVAAVVDQLRRVYAA